MIQIDKATIRKPVARHERDTGSSEVQIAVLTKKIEVLSEHLKGQIELNQQEKQAYFMISNDIQSK